MENIEEKHTKWDEGFLEINKKYPQYPSINNYIELHSNAMGPLVFKQNAPRLPRNEAMVLYSKVFDN